LSPTPISPCVRGLDDTYIFEPPKSDRISLSEGRKHSSDRGANRHCPLRAADRYGQQIALVDGALDVDNRRSWTFEALASDAKRVAHALLERFAFGDHIALWAANCPDWVLIELGAAFAGIVLVPVNPAFLGRELDHVLRKSAARGIIVQDVYRGRNLVDVVEEIAGTLPELDAIVPLSTWKDFLGAATGEGSLPTVRANDMAQIQFTSGTTGMPKGACLTHRGLANNGRIYAEAIGARSGDVWINPMPMFHTAGCGLVTLGALQTGGAHVIPPGFKADDMLELFERERGTIMLCVPTMLIRHIAPLYVFCGRTCWRPSCGPRARMQPPARYKRTSAPCRRVRLL
jgi:fatty-acyl-CoA synthase